jgi:hypothetical protein
MPWSDLPTTGSPNTSIEERDKDGNVTTRRHFGRDGRAIIDIDFDHDHEAGNPHVHDWDWTKDPPRQPGRPYKPGKKSSR